MASYTGRPDSVEMVFLRSPVDLYNKSFELFTAEALVYATCLLGLVHAWYKSKKAGNGESLLFFAIALAAASFVDPICLIHEQIRNYFHSHASILLWDRHVAPWQFPLFACISYVPGAVVWELGLENAIAEAGLVAFVASWTFYCFDLFACRWVLYQWHVTDPLYQSRTECVPLASSMWVMTYAATSSLLARLSYRWIKAKNQPAPKAFEYSWWTLFAGSVLIFLPLHIVPISVAYFPAFFFKIHPKAEYVVVWGFGLLGLVLSILARREYKKDDPTRNWVTIALAFLQTVVWFGSLFFVIAVIDPAKVVSTCVHQPYGGKNARDSELCSVTETYLFGLSERRRYVCDDDLVHWKITSKPKPKDEWYTIQGLPMTPEFFNHYTASLLTGYLIHVVVFSIALSRMKPIAAKEKKEN